MVLIKWVLIQWLINIQQETVRFISIYCFFCWKCYGKHDIISLVYNFSTYLRIKLERRYVLKSLKYIFFDKSIEYVIVLFANGKIK